MGWNICEDGLRFDGQPDWNEDQIRRWLREWLRAPNKPGQICHEIELVMANRFVDAATIMRASKWAHWEHPSKYLARKVLKELFGRVPRRFLDQKNKPIPSWDDVSADYEEWRQAVVDKLPRTDTFPLDRPKQGTSHWMDIREKIAERIKVPNPSPSLTPAELRRMPREQRQAILAKAAELAEEDYRGDKELTKAFEAFSEEELNDD